MLEKMQGIIGYPVTPFTQDGQHVDVDKIGTIIDYMIATEIDAIAPLGSTGACLYLNEEEWKTVAYHSLQYIDKRMPSIIGIASLRLDECIERAKYAEAHGASAVMLQPYSFWPLRENEIYHLFSKVADAISIPIMAYNNPVMSGVDMPPRFMIKMLQEIDNVQMIKEASGDISRLHEMQSLYHHDRIPFFSASDALILGHLCAGAVGWCTPMPLLIPRLNKKLYQLVCKKNMEEAHACFMEQFELIKFVIDAGYPRAIKSGLKFILNEDAGYLREPVLPLPKDEEKTLHYLLEKLR